MDTTAWAVNELVSSLDMAKSIYDRFGFGLPNRTKRPDSDSTLGSGILIGLDLNLSVQACQNLSMNNRT